MSLNAFLSGLLRSNENFAMDLDNDEGLEGGSSHFPSTTKVIIIEDNAQLSVENRMKASESFMSTGSDRPRFNRWSSTPSFSRKNSSSTALCKKDHSKQPRSSSLSMSSGAGRQNATWGNLNSRPPRVLAQHRIPIEDHQANNQDSTMVAPKLPTRSPHSPYHNNKRQTVSMSTFMNPSNYINNYYPKASTMSSSTSNKKKKSLRDALGGMAPKSKKPSSSSSSRKSSPSSSSFDLDKQPKKPSNSSKCWSPKSVTRDLPPVLRDFRIVSPDNSSSSLGCSANLLEQDVRM